MKNEKKKYTVTIFGEKYVLISDDATDHIMRVAALVDSSMQTIAQSSNLPDKKVAVLAALQLAGKLLSLEVSAEKEAVRHKALVSQIDQEFLSTLSS